MIRCNQCEATYKDDESLGIFCEYNAGTLETPEWTLVSDEHPLPDGIDIDRDVQYFDGCVTCKTDAYLMDL